MTNSYQRIRVDHPREHITRITLARPEKRNAMDGVARGEIISALRAASRDENCHVAVIRGDGPSFCAGYDLDPPAGDKYGDDTGGGLGRFPREVVDGWLGLTDLRIPIIAQVHGHCLAGGTELLACCDLVYVADDARIGYPAVRFGVPDMQYHAWLMGPRRALEAMLTGDSLTGPEAVAAGLANRSFPVEELEERTLEVAERVAGIPPEIAQLNKRTVHRAMQAMGMHAAVRAGTEICALGTQTEAFGEFMQAAAGGRVTKALDVRDSPFGDGRTITK